MEAGASLYLEAEAARRLLESADRLAEGETVTLSISFDLHRTTAQAQVSRRDFSAGGRSYPLAPLEEILKKPRKIFRWASGSESSGWEPLEVFIEQHFQLVPTGGAPTLEIDGIQMHRTSGIDPFEWAEQIAAAAMRQGQPAQRVLDVCGGLGYASIQAARRGAAEVVSFEPSEGVLRLRRLNPWSREEQGLPIRLVQGDACEQLAHGSHGAFQAVIHDPPRFALAPELYSAAFYLQLRDALEPGGRLFHYTGFPWSRGRGRDFHRGVKERLARAGFAVEFSEELQGFLGRRLPRQRKERP